MSAIPKVELVGCPRCDSSGGGCAFCSAPDCDNHMHEGWQDCSLCGGAGEISAVVAAVYARRLTEIAPPPVAPIAPDADIRW
jgi:hypothetical protein